MLANGSCLPERSARRSATVTSSAPLAMSASRINSFDANFPVPTSKRDANSRSAILSFEGLSAMPKSNQIHEHARICICGERGHVANTEAIATDKGGKHVVPDCDKQSGRMPDSASKMLALPERKRMRRFLLVRSM